MNDKGGKAEQIVTVAERLVRTNGYNGFSFREIASEVGIKSASVHYHFPTKADLGAAVARRYTERFLAGLGAADDPANSPEALLQRYINAYRCALVDEDLMCLCGVLGAEVDSLPPEVAREARHFFERNLEWLESVLSRIQVDGPIGPDGASRRALKIIAALEGAMILARNLGRNDVFEQIITDLAIV